MPRIIAVIGGKHSGKTTVIEHLIAELTRRGYRVGTIKEMIRIPTLDTPETETDRYRKAGAEAIVAVPRDETVIFVTKRLGVNEVLPFLKGLDYVVLEGFESEKVIPKIVAAKTAEEAQSYVDGSTLAISGIITDSKIESEKVSSTGIPLLNGVRDIQKLTDIVQEKARELNA